MKKVMIIINTTSGGETALDYKESFECKAKEYIDDVENVIKLIYETLLAIEDGHNFKYF